MNNFVKRIDLIGFPLATEFLGSTVGFTATGNDADNGKPDTPFLTLDAVNLGGNNTAVMGADQVYGKLPGTSKEYIGDGRAIVDGQGVDYMVSGLGYMTLESLLVVNCLGGTSNASSGIGQGNTGYFEDVIFKDSGEIRATGSNAPVHRNLVFDNTPARFSGLIVQESIFISSGAQQTIELLGTVESFSSHYIDNQKIICSSTQAEQVEYCYFNNCEFEVDAVLYANAAAVRIAHPSALPNEITGSLDFKGSFSRLEYKVVSSSSALLGSGKFGANLGGVNIGENFNENLSINIGASSNYQFTGGVIERPNSLVVGIIEFDEVQLDRVMLDPFLSVNGYSDYLNNIIRVTNLTNPNKLTVKIQTADNDKVYRPERIFREGFRVSTENGGLSSGDNEYHEDNIVPERVRWVILKIEIN